MFRKSFLVSLKSLLFSQKQKIINLKRRKIIDKMSSGIFFFNTDDFFLKDGSKGKLLGLKGQVNGLHLILFYSKECKFCDKFLAQFKQLPNLILG